MESANTQEKSKENIQNTYQIKMYVVEFIRPKDQYHIKLYMFFLYEIG